MSSEPYDLDLFVIGAGSGGVRASRMAASLGARVAVCESRFLGGTCVNVGCVPKKLLVYGSHVREELEDARGYGWTVGDVAHDWAALIARKDQEIARLNAVYERLLRDRGVEILRGRGVLRDAHTVAVKHPDGTVTARRARYVLLATGGQPVRPSFPGSEFVMVSDDVFTLRAMPRRLLVLGGGYIAVEMACIFHGYGAHVTLAHRGDLVLRSFDRDVRAHLGQEMRKRGVDVRAGAHVQAIERRADGAFDVTFTNGDAVTADAVLAAIGRVPHVGGLGLDAAGVELDARGGVKVDARFCTTAPSVYAVGDVIQRFALTPVALAEGMAVARNLFGGADARVDYDFIPTSVFSNPPVGTVGLSEEEARARCTVDIYRSTFTPMRHTMTGRADKTLMKLVVERETQRVVGLHVVGPDAGEIVQGFAVALKMGATKAQFDATIGIHPTAAEELVTMRERSPDP